MGAASGTVQVFSLSEFGVGQGRRAGVHLFGLTVSRMDGEVLQRAGGAGLDLPPRAARALVGAREGPDETVQLETTIATHAVRPDWDGHIGALHSFPDVVATNWGGDRSVCGQRRCFAANRTACGLRVVCLVEHFLRKTVACFSSGLHDRPHDFGQVCGEEVRATDKVDLWGSLVDAELTFQPLLECVRSQVVSMTTELCVACEDVGLGMPLIDIHHRASGLRFCFACRGAVSLLCRGLEQGVSEAE